MVIVGSGAIGVEFAYFYNSIGTDVTVVKYLPNIVPVEDIDVSKQLQRSFKKSGIKVMTNSSVEKVDTSSEGCLVNIKTKNGVENIKCDIVLSAVGIVSNIEDIGLEEVGIKTENGKILVDDYYKTNIDGYYAIGDLLQIKPWHTLHLQKVLHALRRLLDITLIRLTMRTFQDAHIANQKLLQLV